ncbi:hypothetical protein [Streptomyces sp. NPDC047108]|uniref:hypothetical protein n=1 Tax=Streptomyces sp. NPDC047108 TaxID=3155025 RepID=UPI00340FFB80
MYKRGHKVATAAMVVLAVGGWASVGAGAAFAADGPGARATGGSSTAGDQFQQNTAQSSRQNNNCGNPNTETEEDETISLTGGRLDSRCKTVDGSFNKSAKVRSGGANAEGGSGVDSFGQQNTAQSGRQNNNCANPNAIELISVTGGRVEGFCTDKDRSVNLHTKTKGGPANATGGSGTEFSLNQQNIAQEGRQNNNCANPNDPDVVISGGRSTGHCRNKDASFSRHTLSTGRGANASGGGGLGANIDEQNIAQSGRQNTNCHNPNDADIELTGGRDEADCWTADHSKSVRTAEIGGGAEATGGASGADLEQQNVAQEGRQNTNCANSNSLDLEITGGRTSSRCGHKDGSLNHDTLVKGGGARATGGSSTGGTAFQQNIAQEGKQNNNCANPNAGDVTITGGRDRTDCRTTDHSLNAHTQDFGGGAEAEGGSSIGGELFQQNVAQSGRQNNNCGNPNNLVVTLSGARNSNQCQAVDVSRNIGTVNR